MLYSPCGRISVPTFLKRFRDFLVSCSFLASPSKKRNSDAADTSLFISPPTSLRRTYVRTFERTIIIINIPPLSIIILNTRAHPSFLLGFFAPFPHIWRERGYLAKKRKNDGERFKGGERVRVCVYVCVCKVGLLEGRNEKNNAYSGTVSFGLVNLK